jgi:hypothetical protein
MATSVTSPATARVDAITDLLRSVENLVVVYATLAENERVGRLDQDADRITGEIGRQLHVARVRLAASPRPRG